MSCLNVAGPNGCTTYYANLLRANYTGGNYYKESLIDLFPQNCRFVEKWKLPWFGKWLIWLESINWIAHLREINQNVEMSVGNNDQSHRIIEFIDKAEFKINLCLNRSIHYFEAITCVLYQESRCGNDKLPINLSLFSKDIF